MKKLKYFEVAGRNEGEIYWVNLDKVQYLDLDQNEIVLGEGTWIRVNNESMCELCEYLLEEEQKVES